MKLAAELFAQKGVGATSLASVAEAAGLTAPALYHYFSNRQDLVVEAMRYATTATVELVDSVAAVEGSTHDRLREYAKRHADLLEGGGPGLIRFIYWSVLDAAGDPALLSEINPGDLATEAFTRRLIEEGKAAGDIRAGVDAGTAAELLTSLFTGIHVRYACGRCTVPVRDAFDEAVRLFETYLGAPDRGAPSRVRRKGSAGRRR